MNQRIRDLQHKIDEIRRELCEIGDLRPGSLSQQYNVCGTPGCRCKADPPQRHGPYYQLGWTRHGKSTTRFVRPADLPAVRQELRNYERLQALVERWVTLSMEICEAKKQERKGE
jgi:hypothetical protein